MPPKNSASSTTPKKRGRPRLEIDMNDVVQRMRKGETQEEIAAAANCSPSTIKSRRDELIPKQEDKLNMERGRGYRQGKREGRIEGQNSVSTSPAPAKRKSAPRRTTTKKSATAKKSAPKRSTNRRTTTAKRKTTKK
ncbi:hypothetical protein PCE1_001734 [Barthelona sp. PCE]